MFDCPSMDQVLDQNEFLLKDFSMENNAGVTDPDHIVVREQHGALDRFTVDL